MIFTLHAIAFASVARRHAFPRNRNGQVEHEGQIRDQTSAGGIAKLLQKSKVDPAPVALVGQGRVDEAVAQDDCAAAKSRFDQLDHVLRARGIDEERLGQRSHLQARFEEDMADRTPRLAGHDGFLACSA